MVSLEVTLVGGGGAREQCDRTYKSPMSTKPLPNGQCRLLVSLSID